jgi:hypothetical protein
MEHVLDIVGDCLGSCGRALVSPTSWRPIPLRSKLDIGKDFAQEWKGQGVCANCYRKGFTNKRSIRRRGDFAEDYLIYRRRTEDHDTIAKLMGLKPDSLKRMLERARGRGEL